MAEFILKPTANNLGNFANSVEFADVDITDAIDLEDGTWDVFMRVQSGLVVAAVTAPVAGFLTPISATQGDGAITVNLADGFTGSDLAYSSDQTWATVSGNSLIIADEVRTGTVAVTATNSSGSATLDQSVTISAPVVLPPQVRVVSPIADQSFVQGGGDVTIDLRTVFENVDTYGVSGAGASIDGDGYTLRLDDGTLRAGVTITVTGTNGNGSVDDSFILVVSEVIVTSSIRAEDDGTGTILNVADGQPIAIAGTEYTNSVAPNSGMNWSTALAGGPIILDALTGSGTLEVDGTYTFDLPTVLYTDGDTLTIAVTSDDGTETVDATDPNTPTVVLNSSGSRVFTVTATAGGQSRSTTLTLTVTGAGVGPTEPTIAAPVAQWYDASDATTITLSGAEVVTLADKSANGYDLAPINTGFSVGSQLNGKNTLVLTNNTSMKRVAAVAIPTAFTIATVFRPMLTPNNSNNSVWSFDAAQGIDLKAIVTTGMFGYHTAVGHANLFGATNLVGTTAVMIYENAGIGTNTAKLYIGGSLVAETDVTASASASQIFRLGVNPSEGREMEGLFCEMRRYNGILSATERGNLNDFLTAKWIGA